MKFLCVLNNVLEQTLLRRWFPPSLSVCLQPGSPAWKLRSRFWQNTPLFRKHFLSPIFRGRFSPPPPTFNFIRNERTSLACPALDSFSVIDCPGFARLSYSYLQNAIFRFPFFKLPYRPGPPCVSFVSYLPSNTTFSIALSLPPPPLSLSACFFVSSVFSFRIDCEFRKLWEKSKARLKESF